MKEQAPYPRPFSVRLEVGSSSTYIEDEIEVRLVAAAFSFTRHEIEKL